MASLHTHIHTYEIQFFVTIFLGASSLPSNARWLLVAAAAKKAACSLLHQFRPHRLQAWSEKEDKCARDKHAHVERDRSARVSVVVCRLIGPADIHRSRAISIYKRYIQSFSPRAECLCTGHLGAAATLSLFARRISSLLNVKRDSVCSGVYESVQCPLIILDRSAASMRSRTTSAATS